MMTDAEIVEELDAIHETTSVLRRPTFISRHNWRKGYSTLVRRGLVTWGPFTDGSFGPEFAAVKLTAKGRRLLGGTGGHDA